MFSVNENDVQFLIDSAGQNVLINDKEMKAIITNPLSVVLNEYEQRYIHSVQPIIQGYLVTVNNEKYLVVTESLTKRTTKYKSLMRHCNYTLEMKGETKKVIKRDENGNPVLDKFGDPVYITIQEESVFVPAIVDNKSFSVNLNAQMIIPQNQITVVVQDNTVNRDRFKMNNVFSFVEKNHKVFNRDFTKRGLMILTCESTT
ncbi:hypothetical protein [Neobacillus vireti]|uniref:Ig domain-containing protein n=1 Tax=Neobacillus vireti LMG 21834 TaxID=1131730 RepID=A0AB94IMH5_9BACI|nr:hypothetical protein [Neobacillus vireti]ETI68143.1 Ig domain-containing protein [Neobacillus vireti LMG 21834]KLT15898.1 hypothetical protein AA980_22150 [Neobacillus vireti]